MDDRLPERIAEKIWPEPNTGCWLWGGFTNESGYGRTEFNGRMTYVHRLVFSALRGPIQRGMSVCHRCDNPPCCNPAHLFLGTRADNNADKVRKGRQVRGARHGQAKLCEEQVVAIRDAVRAGESATAVARRFGFGRRSVANAVYGETWAHVPGALPDERVPPTKLSAADVARIRELRAAGELHTVIAPMFGVHPSHICRIASGKYWARASVTK